MNLEARNRIIEIVQRIIDSDGTESELDDLIEELKSKVSDPKVTDYIFWNETEMTAEEIVEKALSYKPIQL